MASSSPPHLSASARFSKEKVCNAVPGAKPCLYILSVRVTRRIFRWAILWSSHVGLAEASPLLNPSRATFSSSSSSRLEDSAADHLLQPLQGFFSTTFNNW